jgi:hypothetical protein
MVPLDEIGFLASGLSLILVHELGHRQSGDDVAAFFALEWLRLSHDTTEYQRMLDAAGKRRFDVLLVWRYDRFARSMQELVNALEEFRTLGIDFVSYREDAEHHDGAGQADLRDHGQPRGVRARPNWRAGQGRHGARQGAGQARRPAADPGTKGSRDPL